jgi:hypothetical protein
MSSRHRIAFGTTLFVLLIGFSGSTAHAASVSIEGVFPSTSVSPGEAVSFQAVGSGFGEPTYSVSGGQGSIDGNGYYTWTPTPEDAGRNDITITVNDLSGAAASSTIDIYVAANTLTISNLLPGSTAFTREPVTFTVGAPGFTNPSFAVQDSYRGTTVSNTDLTANTTGNTANFSWTPTLSEQGMHNLMVTASDSYGHSATLQQPLVVLPPTLQLINLMPGTHIVPGTPFTFSASSTGLTSPTYTVSDSLGWFSSVNASSTDNSGNFSWTPMKTDIGTHILTMTASDANDSTVSTAVTVVVSATMPTTQSVASTTTPTSLSGTITSAASPTATGSKQDGYVFTKYLQIGSSGAAVTELQKHLAIDGVYAASNPITGYFGHLTFLAVQQFQTKHGIAALGVTGPQTRAALNGE